MDPVKVFRDGTCFIALQVADKVPGQALRGRRLDFLEALLDEIFAKVALPGRRRRENLVQGLLFADGEQIDGIGVATGFARRNRQQIAD